MKLYSCPNCEHLLLTEPNRSDYQTEQDYKDAVYQIGILSRDHNCIEGKSDE